MIQGHSKRKTIIRSSCIFVLVLSILLSSVSISFASYDPAPGLTEVNDLVQLDGVIDWVANWFERDPDGYLWIYKCTYNGVGQRMFCGFCSADTSIYFNNSSGQVFLNSTTGFDLIVVNYVNGVQYNFGNTAANQGPTSEGSYPVDGTTYYPFRLPLNNLWQCDFYCSVDFIDNGGDVPYNLDVSGYKPPELVFDVWLTQNNDLIGVTVDFDVATHYNFITLWGYDEYGPMPITYNTSEYRQIHYDMTDRLLTTFYLPIQKIFMYAQGHEFHVSSISCVGWNEDTEEQTKTLNWDLTNGPGLEYDSPSNNYYYDSFYNENYNYITGNGAAYAYGHISLTFSTDIHAPVFWDTEETLIQPYAYTYIAIPVLSAKAQLYFQQSDSIIYKLLSSYDIVIVNVNETAFDNLYGPGAYQNFQNNVDALSVEQFYLTFNEWYDNHTTPTLHPLPYNLINNKPTHTSTYSVGIFYSHTFYQKSILYLLGDNNDRLLEFETRILGEDGFAQELLTSLKKIYDLQYDSFSDSIDYLKKIQYFTNQVLLNDYFGQLITGIITLDASINGLESSFSSSIAGTNNLLNRINESILGLDLSFENITLQFPEFNFDIIVDNHPTSNIEYFVDFVNNFFTALPDADYSPLENIETDFSDIFDDLHIDDTYDNFLDSILDDYEFSDSHLSDYD